MKITYPLIRVTHALLDNPSGPHWGYDLSKQAGVRSGVLYPILGRLYNSGWLSDGWEKNRVDGRPPRRYYQVTPEGQRGLEDLLAQARKNRPDIP